MPQPAPTTPAAPAAPAAPPKLPLDAWASGIKVNLQLEGGVVFNTASPSNGENFGQLFTDQSNNFQLNQALVTVQRTPDPKVDYDLGFALQGLYGTDARYLHFVGVLDRATDMRYQPALLQANVQLHTPWLFGGGIDFKAGMYSTPIGYEVIDPSLNPFYSHSYIFNFGIPLEHTGVLAIAHVTDMVDVYASVDSGVNTAVGPYVGDNNSSAAGLGGFQLTLLGGNLTILALTHIGPENPRSYRAAGQPLQPLHRRLGDHLEGDRQADPGDRTGLHPRRQSRGRQANGVRRGAIRVLCPDRHADAERAGRNLPSTRTTSSSARSRATRTSPLRRAATRSRDRSMCRPRAAAPPTARSPPA